MLGNGREESTVNSVFMPRNQDGYVNFILFLVSTSSKGRRLPRRLPTLSLLSPGNPAYATFRIIAIEVNDTRHLLIDLELSCEKKPGWVVYCVKMREVRGILNVGTADLPTWVYHHLEAPRTASSPSMVWDRSETQASWPTLNFQHDSFAIKRVLLQLE